MEQKDNIAKPVLFIISKCSEIKRVMPDINIQQVALSFTFLRRVDCLVGQYTRECSTFYSKNKETLSDERLDAKLRDIAGGYPFYNYSGYSINDILRANTSIEAILNSYLQGFSKNLLEILDGLNFKMNLAILQRQPRYLVDLLRFFSEIDLTVSTVDNADFVELISYILSLNTGEKGVYCSPIALSILISECLFSKDLRHSEDENITIYDPVCGTGSLLAFAGIKAKDVAVHQDKISLYGQEISLFSTSIAKALVLLTGNENSHVMYGNTLTDDLFPQQQFQYIVADIPFRQEWRLIKERVEKESLDINGRFHLGLPALIDSQLLFIEHILSKMDSNGSRAAFITTSSILTSSNTKSGESKVRRWLIENDMVETIIALPKEFNLPATNIPIYLWFLSNNKDNSQKGNIRLINATALSESQSRLRIGDSIKSIVDEYKSNVISTMSKVVKNDRFGFYEVGLLKNKKKNGSIQISLDTDIDEYVQKEIQPYVEEIISVDYSSAEKGYVIEFDEYFKSAEIESLSLEDSSDDMESVIDIVSSYKSIVQQTRELKRNTSVPESWKILPLRAATEIISGISTLQPTDKGLPILNASYLRNNNDVLFGKVTSKTKCATVNDALIVTIGANAGEVFRGKEGILSPTVAAVRCTNEEIITQRYLYYLLKGHESSLRFATIGNMKRVVSRTLLDLKCLIPPIEEQIKISSYLDNAISKIDEIMNALKSKDNTFAVFRQALIENLVQGKYSI